jgi:hypothetical protein
MRIAVSHTHKWVYAAEENSQGLKVFHVDTGAEMPSVTCDGVFGLHSPTFTSHGELCAIDETSVTPAHGERHYRQNPIILA